ncbi:MAG: RHS repeat protein, partial [Oscillospiraceae bacterium]|nr:RHS repeat protein [Oscillospiraceae bacterium]
MKKVVSLLLANLLVFQLLPMEYLGVKAKNVFAYEKEMYNLGYNFEIPKETDNKFILETPETFVDDDYQNEKTQIDDILTDNITEEQKSEILSNSSQTTSEDYIEPPYVYQYNQNEKIALSSGSLIYENVDYVLPGRNGLDLVISRRYKTSNATLLNTYIEKTSSGASSIRTQNNDYMNSLYELGHGWEFGFTSINCTFDRKTLYLYDGRTFGLSEGETAKMLINGESHPEFEVLHYQTTISETGDVATYTIEYNNGITEYLSSTGKLMYRKDIYGNRIIFNYCKTVDENTDILIITDSLNRQITISKTLNENGHTITVYLPNNLSLNYNVEYHESGLESIASFTNTIGNTTFYTYNIFPLKYSNQSGVFWKGNNYGSVLSIITHPTNNQTRFEFETVGLKILSSYFYYVQMARIMSRFDLSGEDVSNHVYYEYTDSTKEIDGVKITVGISEATTSVRYPSGLIMRYDFTGDGKVSKEEVYNQDKLVESTEYSYNYLHNKLRPSKITKNTYGESQNKMETITLMEYKPYDYPKTIWSTYSNGQKLNEYATTYSYFGDANLLESKTYKTDQETTIKIYNTHSFDYRFITASKIYVNDNIVQTTDYTYDSYGNILSEKTYGDVSNEYILSEYTYQEGAYLTQEKHTSVKTSEGAFALGTSGNNDGIILFNYTYDVLGNLVSSTDGNGNITLYSYDSIGNIICITNPDGTTVTYTRDYEDNYIIVKDENGAEIKYTYTPLGLEYETVDVLTGNVITRKEYDSSSRLIKVSEFIYGSVTEYEYDFLDRVTSETIKQGNTILSQTLYEYEHAVENGTYNKVTKTVVGDSNAPSVVTTEYTDKHGNIAKTGKIIDSVEYFDTYDYNYVGNQTNILTAADAEKNVVFTAKYEYNYNGQVTKAYNAENQYTTNTYDAFGNLVSATDYAGTPTEYIYDSLGRLTSQTITIEEGETSRTKYEYDASGNIIREWRQNNAVGSSENWAKTEYVYDGRNRLVSLKQYNNSSVVSTTSYTYDGVGNVLTMTSGGNTTTYTYDRFGNVLTEKDAFNRTKNYTYGVMGRLESVTDRNGIETEYFYDALGRIIKTRATDGTDTEIRTFSYSKTGQVLSNANDNSTTIYTYDDLGRVANISEFSERITEIPEDTDPIEPEPETEPEPEPEPEP